MAVDRARKGGWLHNRKFHHHAGDRRSRACDSDCGWHAPRSHTEWQHWDNYRLADKAGQLSSHLLRIGLGRRYGKRNVSIVCGFASLQNSASSSSVGAGRRRLPAVPFWIRWKPDRIHLVDSGESAPGLAAKRNHRLHRMRTGDSRHSHHVGFVSDHSHAYGFSGRFGVGANYLDCGLWDASADTGSGSASGYHWHVLQLFLRRQRRNSPLHMEFQRQRTRPGASIGAQWNAERNSDSGEHMSFWAQQHVVWRGHADPVQRSDVMNLSFVVSSGSDARTRLRDSGN